MYIRVFHKLDEIGNNAGRVFPILYLKLNKLFFFFRKKQKFLYLNSQPTDSQSGTPQSRL